MATKIDNLSPLCTDSLPPSTDTRQHRKAPKLQSLSQRGVHKKKGVWTVNKLGRSVDLKSAEKANDNTDHSHATLRKTDEKRGRGGRNPQRLVLPMPLYIVIRGEKSASVEPCPPTLQSREETGLLFVFRGKICHCHCAVWKSW